GEQEWHRQRQLDLPQELEIARPHAPGRVHDGRVHTVDANQRVQEDRQDREQGEREERRLEPDAEERQRQRQHGEARDRLARIRDQGHRLVEHLDAARQDRQRDRDDQADEGCVEHERHVLAEEFPELVLVLSDVIDEIEWVIASKHAYPLSAFTRISGRSSNASLENPYSASSARMMHISAPATIRFESMVRMPSKINRPSPPPPMTAAIAPIPIPATVARRIPAKMYGMASGSSTSLSRWNCPIPMPRAASTTEAGTSFIPAAVLRTIARSE